jgi:hypothetical protein
MKYIFLAGAPGSKWSSVAKNIYYSDDIDRSDYRDDWTYHHDASGQMELMHLGAYFDPGMACGLPENITGLDQAQLEKHFDLPFDPTATGTKIIKSHIFSYESNIRHLRRKFLDCAIVLVHRSDDACLGWWVKCGHFDITYPDYREYYQDLKTMASIIAQQNDGIEQVMASTPTAVSVRNNRQLCRILGIAQPPVDYWQNYAASDIKVHVL